MFSARIADQLTHAGCDCRAVSADPQLRGVSDAELLEYATRFALVVITSNTRDFMHLAREWADVGRRHSGLLFVPTKTFPMSKDREGRIAAALMRRCREKVWPPAGHYDYLRR